MASSSNQLQPMFLTPLSLSSSYYLFWTLLSFLGTHNQVLIQTLPFTRLLLILWHVFTDHSLHLEWPSKDQVFKASFQAWGNTKGGLCRGARVIGVLLRILGSWPPFLYSSFSSLSLLSPAPVPLPSSLLLSHLQNRLLLLLWPTIPSQSQNNQDKRQWIETSEVKINLYYLVSCLMWVFLSQ